MDSLNINKSYQRNGAPFDMSQIYNKVKENDGIDKECKIKPLKAIAFDHVDGERIVLVDEISEVVIINNEAEPKKETVLIGNDTMQEGYYFLKSE